MKRRANVVLIFMLASASYRSHATIRVPPVLLSACAHGYAQIAPPSTDFAVTQAQIEAIVPQDQRQLAHVVESLKAAATSIRQGTGPFEKRLTALSELAIVQVQKSFEKAGVRTKLIRINQGKTTERNVLQIVDGAGVLGAFGRATNKTGGPFAKDLFIYDPYYLFSGNEAWLGTYQNRDGTHGPRGIRLGHQIGVDPNGLSNEVVNHEIGHNVAQIFRDRGIDNGLLGYLVGPHENSLALEGYSRSMAIGEAHQYLVSAVTAYKHLRTIASAAPSAITRTKLRKAELSVQRRLDQARSALGYSMAHVRHALEGVARVNDQQLRSWVATADVVPMKDHQEVLIPFGNENGMPAYYLTAYVPKTALRGGSLFRQALAASLTKTQTKLFSLQTTLAHLGDKIHPITLDYSAGRTPQEKPPAYWTPKTGERVVLRTEEEEFNAHVYKVNDHSIFVEWSDAAGEKSRAAIGREYGDYYEPDEEESP